MLPDGLTIPLIIAAALADSINPCVFGVLIFLCAFMLKTFKNPLKMLWGGLLYSLVVYLTYLLIGLGFIQFTVSFGVSVIVYWIAAVLAILAGLIEIKDFFWYGKGFSLQIIPGAAKRIGYYTTRIKKSYSSRSYRGYLGAGLLVVFVVLVELPCTGAPYLVVLALIGQGNYVQGLPLLLLYNLIFILPLLVIIGLVYAGKSAQALEKWRKENRKWMRLGVGLFLIALGIYMIFTIS
ncbi:MAG TPA: sulfite exporter TauE/SafE family protein [Candidatus Nanoarchaeia archaeon]|nr:sulfite exporter TauE/SafE family protein [Candidatus Nanoarchaeia archaeon]